MSKIVTFCFTSEEAKELYKNQPPEYETPFRQGRIYNVSFLIGC